ncbi:MAG: hypothetical protein V1755_14940 [Chloroflexota bacterium]
MPIDLSSFDISVVGWILIGVAGIVLAVALLRLLGHLLHLLLRGCGVILVVLVALYILRFLGVI